MTLNKKYHGISNHKLLTGYQHPKCFLQSTSDCSTKISSEHYISKSVLIAIQKGEEKLIRFSGAPWIPRGTEKLISVESLKSNILCRRHNSMLHPLDDTALSLMKAFVTTFDGDLVGDTNRITLVSGHAFEAWAIKTAVGCFHSGMFADGDGTPVRNYGFAPNALLPALRGEPLPHGCGLYMQVGVGFETPGHPPFQITPLLMTHLGNRYVVGADLAIFGVLFRVIFDPEGVMENLTEEGWAFRPGIVQFSRPDFSYALALSWSDGSLHGKVDFDLRPEPSC